MDTPQEHRGQLEEPEQREGPGGPARRFGDTELSWVRDKDNRRAETPTDHPGNPDPDQDPAGRGDVTDRGSGPAPETRVYEPPQADQPGPASDSESVAAHTGGDTDRPARTASSDAEGESGLRPAGAEKLPGRFDDQAAADKGAARVGLLTNAAGLRDEWERVQGTFVDDPQRAVREASVLVERTLDEIRVNVTSGHTSDTTSTEDLRVSFQRYREFFQRLLSA
jgi:hypothetical protein